MLDEAWLKDFRWEFLKHMNIRAPFEREVAPEGFRCVLCCIQKGLGRYRKILLEILSAVDEYQSGRGDYRFCLCSFGGDDQRLLHPERPLHIPGSANVYFLADTLGELAGDDPPSAGSVLPRFLPDAQPYEAVAPLGSADLSIFICGEADVRLPSSLKKEYARIKENAVWLFLKKVDVEARFGEFEPAFSDLP